MVRIQYQIGCCGLKELTGVSTTPPIQALQQVVKSNWKGSWLVFTAAVRTKRYYSDVVTCAKAAYVRHGGTKEDADMSNKNFTDFLWRQGYEQPYAFELADLIEKESLGPISTAHDSPNTYYAQNTRKTLRGWMWSPDILAIKRYLASVGAEA